LTVVPVQSQTRTVASFYVKLSSRSVAVLMTDSYPALFPKFRQLFRGLKFPIRLYVNDGMAEIAGV